MSISAYRTVVLGGPSLYMGGIPAPPHWPMAHFQDNLDYSANACRLLSDVGDSAAAVSMALAPSGDGELQLSDMTVNGDIITVQLAGGVPGRSYQARIACTGLSGRVWERKVGLRISRDDAPCWPPAAAPSEGYGTALTWSSGVTAFGSAFVAVAMNQTATGNSQATAFLLNAQMTAFSTVAPGTGALLPVEITSGKFDLTNYGAYDLLVYPPVGAQFIGYAVNAPVAIAPGASATFSTQSPTTEWSVR